MSAWLLSGISQPQQSFVFLGVLFCAGALWFWHARRRGLYAQRRVWAAFVVEVLQVAAVLVPAYVGGWAPWVMAIGLGAPSAGEAAAAAARAWPGQWWPRVGAVAAVAAGFSAYAWLASLPHGFLWVLLAYGVAEVHDVAAFMAGAAVGRRALAPSVSPGKTWEGEMAGVLAGALFAAVLVCLLPPLRSFDVLARVPCILVAGLLGDLAASYLKRLACIKDFSARVPSQGGVLDLYDAWVAVAPVMAAFHLLMDLGS